ncbi:MAG: rod shape-determining protein [Verrucomicrobiales bacterium]
MLNIFTHDLGIDLGAANALVYVREHGVVLREPAVVAVERATNRILAVGDEAKRMLGRTPEKIIAMRPRRDGVVANLEITEAMLRHFIEKVHSRRKKAKPRIVLAVPSAILELERRSLKETGLRAGAREVHLIEEPLAAAIGAGLPVQDAAANLIVDIGASTTEVALISLSGVVFSRSVRVAGDKLDEAITRYLRRAYDLLIGERTAEEIKIKIGSAYNEGRDTKMDVQGRHLMTERPRTVTIHSEEIRSAMEDPLQVISDTILAVLEQCPPELAVDLVDRGLVLAGGGALLGGVSKFLAKETGLPVHVAEDPLSAVVEGTGRLLDELRFVKRSASDAERQWN